MVNVITVNHAKKLERQEEIDYHTGRDQTFN